MIDIGTFFLTITAAAVVRKGIAVSGKTEKEPFLAELKEGWHTITDHKGVLMLAALSSVITMFMGMAQILAEPLLLSFCDAKTLGIAETVCASGMLVSGIIVGVKGIKNGFVRILSIALALSGLFLAGFGLTENILVVCVFGFLFFAALPFANNCLDYLARTNIPDALQGRAWGMIGFISQLGYVVAYAVSGISADTIGEMTGMGVGRGAAVVIRVAGICLAVFALCIPMVKSVRRLEVCRKYPEFADIREQNS